MKISNHNISRPLNDFNDVTHEVRKIYEKLDLLSQYNRISNRSTDAQVSIGTTRINQDLQGDYRFEVFTPTGWYKLSSISQLISNDSQEFSLKSDKDNLTINDTSGVERFKIENDGSISIGKTSFSDTVYINANVGIGVVDPDTPLEISNSSTQLKLSYDSDSYATMAVDSSSNITIDPAESGSVIIPNNKKLHFGATDTANYIKLDTFLYIVSADKTVIDCEGTFTVNSTADIRLDANGADFIFEDTEVNT